MFKRFNQLRNYESLGRLVGKKAESLIMMIASGFPVPDGGCITIDGLRQFIYKNEIDPLIVKLNDSLKSGESQFMTHAKRIQDKIRGGIFPKELEDALRFFKSEFADVRFAVRSSGTKEDMEQASFAGQYVSILNVSSIDELLSAVKECWASLFNLRVLQYCINKHIDFSDMQLAVIIQKMVPAEKSGVIFSVNPLKGFDTEILIEACFGIGEAIVGGDVTPDQYYFNWHKNLETQRVIGDKKISIIPIDEPPFTKKIENSREVCKKEVLTFDEVKELSDITVRIQVLYGFPVDIEWAKFKGKLYILQSRPITTLSYNGIEGEWTTADFKDGGVSSTVCSQFMGSLYELAFIDGMPSYYKKVKLLDDDKGLIWTKMFFGRLYWNVSIIKDAVKKIPGFVEREFDENLGIEVTYPGDGFVSKTTLNTLRRGIQALFAIKKAAAEQLKSFPKFKAQQLKKLEELDKLDPESLGRQEFVKFYEEFIRKEYSLSEATYFAVILNNSNLSSIFKDHLKKITTDVYYPNITSTINDFSNIKSVLKNITALIPSSTLSSSINNFSNIKHGLKEIKDFISNPSVSSTIDNLSHIKKNLKELTTIVSSPNIPSTFKNLSYIKDRLKKVTIDIYYPSLISGLNDLSHMLPNFKLWDISREIRKNDNSLLFWKNTHIQRLMELLQTKYSDHLMDEVGKFIKEFGYHSMRELDITVPRNIEDPSFILQNIKELIELDDKFDPRISNGHQHEIYLKEKDRLLNAIPFFKRKKVEKQLEELRSFLWWREELRDFSVRFYYQVRRFTLVMGKHFYDMGIISDFNDIFYFHLEEIFAIVHGKISGDVAKELINKNIKYYKSFRNFQNPNEIGKRHQKTQAKIYKDAKLLSGIPCSTGSVTGRAKVIKDIFDANRIEKGDILITKFTDPGWTPKFSLISGVATETGGLLSHAAVISREYGIPAVLAIQNLTSIVKDGQKITINGDSGEIILHNM